MRGITLFSLFNLALKHIFVLILSAIICAAGAFAYCEFVATPRYAATGSLLITNGAVDIGIEIDENGDATRLENSDVVASINFMETANDMLEQVGIYKQLAQKLDNKFSYSQLKSMVTIEHRGERSLYLDVTFTATSPVVAKNLVNEFMALTPNYFKSQVNSVAISYFDVDSAAKVYPNTAVTIILFAILGAVAVYGLLLIAFLFNTAIVHEDDFKDRFDIPVIGTIPDFATAKSKKYSKYYNKYGNYYNYYENYGGSN